MSNEIPQLIEDLIPKQPAKKTAKNDNGWINLLKTSGPIKKKLTGIRDYFYRKYLSKYYCLVRDYICQNLSLFRTKPKNSKKIIIIAIFTFLMVFVTGISIYLNTRSYSETSIVSKAAEETKRIANTSAELLSAGLLPTPSLENFVGNWFTKVKAANNNRNGIDGEASGGFSFKAGNIGGVEYNRDTAPEAYTNLRGNFIFKGRLEFPKTAIEAGTFDDRILAVQVGEQGNGPFDLKFAEIRFSSIKGVSSLAVVTKNWDDRIENLLDAKSKTKSQLDSSISATPSLPAKLPSLLPTNSFVLPTKMIAPTYPVPSGILNNKEKIYLEMPLPSNVLFFSVERGGGVLLLKYSYDGVSWQDLTDFFINGLSSDMNIRVFLYSSSERIAGEGIFKPLEIMRQEDMIAKSTVIQELSGLVKQWAYKARASSEYSDTLWSANQATGESLANTCGDAPTAWSSKTATKREWLELRFEKPVYPTQIRIRESNNPGKIYLVEYQDDKNEFVPIWSGADFTACMDYLVVNFKTKPNAPVNLIRIHIDETDQGNWTQIDAVQLLGYEK